MATNPISAIVAAVSLAMLTQVVVSGAASAVAVEFPHCDGVWDFITGCDDGLSKLVAIVAIGAIPTAPDIVNKVMVPVGLTARGTVLWAIAELLRGK